MVDEFKTVWFLNAICNYNCEYCLDVIKNRPIEEYVNETIPDYFIQNMCKNLLSLNRSKYNFSLYGGETTLYPSLDYLIEILYSTFKEKLNRIIIITNGSRSKEYFSKFLKFDNRLIFRLSGHMQHYTSKFIDLVDFLCENNRIVEVDILFNLNYKNKAIELVDTIAERQKKYSKIRGKFKPVFATTPFDHYFYEYTDEDIKLLEEKNRQLGYTAYSWRKDYREFGKYCIVGSQKIMVNSKGIISHFCIVSNKVMDGVGGSKKSIFVMSPTEFRKQLYLVVKCDASRICHHGPKERYNTKKEAKEMRNQLIKGNNEFDI